MRLDSWWKFIVRGFVAVATGALLLARSVSAQSCAGDCNGDAHTSFSEVFNEIRFILGDQGVLSCAAMDWNSDGVVTIEDLVRAQSNAVCGCGRACPTMSATQTRISTMARTPSILPTFTPLSRTPTPCPSTLQAYVFDDDPYRNDSYRVLRILPDIAEVASIDAFEGGLDGEDLAVDADGNLYLLLVPDDFPPRLLRFNSAGALIQQIPLTGYPAAIAVAPNGSVYVLDVNLVTDAVQLLQISPSSRVVASLGMFPDGLDSEDLAVDAAGNLSVLLRPEDLPPQLLKFTPAGERIEQIPLSGHPTSLAVGPGNAAYVIDKAYELDTARIVEVSPGARQVATLGTFPEGLDEEYLAIDKGGNFYALLDPDDLSPKLLKLTAEGIIVQEVSLPGDSGSLAIVERPATTCDATPHTPVTVPSATPTFLAPTASRTMSRSATSTATRTRTPTLPRAFTPTSTRSPTVAPTPTIDGNLPPLQRGLRQLGTGNLHEADLAFAQARAAAPNDDTNKLLSCLTHFATVIAESPVLRDLAVRSGGTVTGTSSAVCEMTVSIPSTPATTAPRSGELVAASRTIVLPAVQTAIDCLRSISRDVRIQFHISDLPPCARRTFEVTQVEVDHGDVLGTLVGLEAAAFALDLAQGYDLDASLPLLFEKNARRIFDSEPQLLTLRSAPSLLTARQHLDNAMADLISGMDFILAEPDAQDDDLLVIDPEDVEAAREARALTSSLRQALIGLTELPIDVVTGEIALMDIGLIDTERLDLSRFFNGQLTNLRHLLPPFDGAGNFDTSRFPDPKFGGIAPDLTQNKMDHFLEGGPACVPCERDEDCTPFGIGKYECEPCYGFDCNDPQPRCRKDFEQPC